jgi:hypothetical protein
LEGFETSLITVPECKWFEDIKDLIGTANHSQHQRSLSTLHVEHTSDHKTTVDM